MYPEADLEVEVRDQQGQLLAEVPLELHWLEEEERGDVRSWIGKRSLDTTSAELVTGSSGRWGVEQVPVGRYSISAPGLPAPLEVELGPEGNRFQVVLP